MAYPNTSQYATISTQNSSGKLNTSISFTVCTIFFIFSVPFFSLICRPAPVLAHLHREGSRFITILLYHQLNAQDNSQDPKEPV